MKLKGYLALVVLFVVIALVAGLGASFYVAATGWRSPAPAAVTIPPGTSVRGIAERLAAERVIRTPQLFELVARAKGVGEKLRAGVYDFPAGTTMLAALDKLVRGDVRQYAFTIIEGWTVEEIAAALEGQPYLASPEVPAEVVRLASDEAFVASLGFEGIPSLEGYCFPDTYLIADDLTAKWLLTRLVERFRVVWNALDTTGLGEAGPRGVALTPREVVILASIVEKETGAADERPLVASVFLNRLRQGMALQSDPTIIYGLEDFDGNIRKRDIENPHPYNTYVHAGLPPGPIANPGRASLEAVLHPADTNYLYFVSRNDGTHEFSASLSDHLKAVRRYQLNRKSP